MKPSRVRVRAHKDANHDELVRHWLALGGSWQDTHQIAGALDGIAGIYGIDQRIEIKNPDSERGTPSALKLTKAEQETVNAWRGRRPVVWTCTEDVEATRAVLLEAYQVEASVRRVDAVMRNNRSE
jgi:hypothetical protein